MIWLLALGSFSAGAWFGILMAAWLDKKIGLLGRDEWEDMEVVAREYGWEVREPRED